LQWRKSAERNHVFYLLNAAIALSAFEFHAGQRRSAFDDRTPRQVMFAGVSFFFESRLAVLTNPGHGLQLRIADVKLYLIY
jgi:hypothetical protein